MTASASPSRIIAPPAGTYGLDTRHSGITFHTRHMFGLGPVHGTFALRDGSLTVAEPVEKSSVRTEIDAASFQTGTVARDKVVCSKTYLDTERHPAITFTSTGLAEAEGRWLLHGTVTVRGTSAPVTLTIERCRFSGGELSAHATTRVDRRAFGVTAQRGMTGRYLDLELDVVARPNQGHRQGPGAA